MIKWLFGLYLWWRGLQGWRRWAALALVAIPFLVLGVVLLLFRLSRRSSNLKHANELGYTWGRVAVGAEFIAQEASKMRESSARMKERDALRDLKTRAEVKAAAEDVELPIHSEKAPTSKAVSKYLDGGDDG